MHRIGTFRYFNILFALALLLPALALGGANPAHAQSDESDRPGQHGVVFTMTNEATGNRVIMYNRAPDGTLSNPRSFSTGGLGSGDALGSQGSLVFGDHDRLLFAVNAGSDEISVFAVLPNRLVLLDKAGSGGRRPVSVTVYGNLVYVLNAGAPENITGFRLGFRGLREIDGSTRPLSGILVGPAQVEFSPRGNLLVVTEKMTNKIDTYTVGRDGLANGPTVHASVGIEPFGFAFDRSAHLIVSEAFQGVPDASAASSYMYSPSGDLTVISGSVHTTETAACWVVINDNQRYAYTTNTGSGTISGFHIGNDGSLTLLDKDGVTGETGPTSMPIDAGFSQGSRFLYVLTPGTLSISAFQVNSDGSLTTLPGATGLPITAAGLAAR
jgi:6-phosphogluconolactonase